MARITIVYPLLNGGLSQIPIQIAITANNYFLAWDFKLYEMRYSLLFIFIVILSQVISGQELVYKTVFDFNKDGVEEQILFYDDGKEEFEKTQFTTIDIIMGADTISYKYDEVWVVRENLYNVADEGIDDRVGVFYEEDKILLWLTGFQYACCLNATTILELTKDSLKPIFNEEYEVAAIKDYDGKRYMIGDYSMSEAYTGFGQDDIPFFYVSFFPTEFRELGNDMHVDSVLTQMMNLDMTSIEDNIDVFNATVVHVKHTSEDIMISYKMEEELSNRNYGIISLTKLDEEFLKPYSSSELRIIRNELFAYHGYRFSSQDLNNHFSKNAWYKPFTTNSDSVFQSLSDIEKYNVTLIKKMESSARNID